MKHKAVGLFGGTFDPIHNGHIEIAERLLSDLALDKIYFIPCKQPVLKQAASATPEQRVAMLKLAIDDNKQLIIDQRELTRTTPSYTIDTLNSFRQEMPDTPLYFILGMDAFLSLPQWHQWQALLAYCHFIVINRPCDISNSPPQLAQLIKQHQVETAEELHNQSAGKLLFLNYPPIDLSSTAIRNKVTSEKIINQKIPKAVAEYIKKYQLYTKM